MTKCCFQVGFLNWIGFLVSHGRVSEGDVSCDQSSVNCSNICPGCAVGIWLDVKKCDCKETSSLGHVESHDRANKQTKISLEVKLLCISSLE